jgi:hypothetical protein
MAVGSDHFRCCDRPACQLALRHQTVYQTEPSRLRGIDQSRRQEQVHGVKVTDLLDQLDGRAAERIDRPLDLGQAKARRRHAGAEVGREHQLQAATNAIAVHCSDDRLRIGIVLQQSMVDHPCHFGPGRQIAADIGADGEGAFTRTCQNNAAAIPVALQFVPYTPEFAQHRSRHSV